MDLSWLFEELSVVGPVAAGIFGALFGSFLNVVIHRLPRDSSLIYPSSHCPHCEQPIAWYHNVPIVSWLWLRGRCANCQGQISIRYPLVELLSALLSVLVWERFGPSHELLIYWPFVLAMLALAFIDLEHQILPDEITVGGAVLGLYLSFFNPLLAWWEAFLGAALGFGFLWALAWAYLKTRGDEGLGFGDVKMMACIGAYGGYQSIFGTLLLASVGGLLVALVLMALGRGGMKTRIPFGTFLAPAAVVLILYGRWLMSWYGGLFIGGGPLE